MDKRGQNRYMLELGSTEIGDGLAIRRKGEKTLRMILRYWFLQQGEWIYHLLKWGDKEMMSSW